METNTISQKLVKYSHEMLCALDLDGHFIFVSEACERILGYKRGEMEGKHFSLFVAPSDISMSLRASERLVKEYLTQHLENRFLHKEGHEVPLLWTATHEQGENLIYCTVRDATQQQSLRQKVIEKETLYQALIRHGSDMLALLDSKGNFRYSNNATYRILGYQEQDLLGKGACGLIHPKDQPMVKEAWAQLDSSILVKLKDFRLKDAAGNWRWVEVIVSNQLENPAIGAVVVSSRDITERKLGRLKLEESEQRYRALFENNPDIVIFENREGVVTEVNQAFCKLFGTSLESIIGKSVAKFLPADLAAVNERSLQEALLGSTLRFDMELPSPKNGSMVLDTVKFPVPVGGQVIGAQTIAKDITPIVRSFETIERQSKKLSTILESITDAFFTLDTAWRYTYVNREYERVTGLRAKDCIGKHAQEVNGCCQEPAFYTQYLEAAASGQSVHFVAFSKGIDKWLEVKAFPSEEGLTVYFADVTDTVKAKEEVEKLSLVASKTDNGVVITDASGITEWVNESFCHMTGYTFEELIGKKPGHFLQGAETETETVQQISQSLEQGKPISATLINYRKSGVKFWNSMDITPVFDDAGTLTRFIAVQRDITYQKETESNLLEMTRHLYQQNKDLQEFTYIVSHNLRAPVVNALGLSHLLQKGDQDADAFKISLNYLKKSLLQIDTVLKDVNTVLSVRGSQDVVEMEQVLLLDVFNEAKTHLQEAFLRNKGEVSLEVEPGLQIRANRAYLFSIFYNLLSNTIKYRSEERLLRVTLRAEQHADGSLQFMIADNGTGFDTEKARDRIFKLYKRFHKDKKGRGVGLFLVKSHVEAMGWQVEVSSEVGQGTTFRIRIPANT